MTVDDRGTRFPTQSVYSSVTRVVSKRSTSHPRECFTLLYLATVGSETSRMSLLFGDDAATNEEFGLLSPHS